MIFALALASNLDRERHFAQAYQAIQQLGECQFSQIYEIPCRDGIGADYWNSACLLKCDLTVDEVMQLMKQLEEASGRIRPSHKISLDIDVIAWGEHLDQMQFNQKKLPLAQDVKIPMNEIWALTI